jgi:hypothetical protein
VPRKKEDVTMNQHERQAAKRKWRAGDVIYVQYMHAVMRDGTHAVYWVHRPDGMTAKEAASTQEWHGPFKSEEEAREDQRIVLFGPQCKIEEGGQWNPAWDKPQ